MSDKPDIQGDATRGQAEALLQLLRDEYYLHGEGVVRFVNPLFERYWARFEAVT